MSFLGKTREWLGFKPGKSDHPKLLSAHAPVEMLEFDARQLPSELAERVQQEGRVEGLWRGVRIVLHMVPMPAEFNPSGSCIQVDGYPGGKTAHYGIAGEILEKPFDPTTALDRPPALWLTRHG